MNRNLLIILAKLRLSVGFMGEAHQKAWWPSNFFSPNSQAFLKPVFAKTPLLAEYYGVKEAANLVHDEHIGIGKGVYHLFRLPEMIEVDLHELLSKQTEAEDVEFITSNPEAAETFLHDNAKQYDLSDTGPVWMGDSASMNNKSSWQKAAHLYLTAFSEGKRIYPYFSGMK